MGVCLSGACLGESMPGWECVCVGVHLGGSVPGSASVWKCPWVGVHLGGACLGYLSQCVWDRGSQGRVTEESWRGSGNR